MDSKYKVAIEGLYEELDALGEQAKQIKGAINTLTTRSGGIPPFADTDQAQSARSGSILPDQFFGMGFVTAVRAYLKHKNRAAPAKEIFEALKSGGYEFSGDEKVHWRGFTINMSKNKSKFVYVKPSDSWGLMEFYPGYKAKKEKKDEEPDEATEEQSEETNNEEESVISDEDQTKAATMKLLITKEDEKRLRELGYSKDQINKMKPEEAGEIIEAGVEAEQN